MLRPLLALAAVLPINISVPAHAVRRYDEFASAKPDSDVAADVVPGLSVALEADHPRPHQSCRHVLENAIPKNLLFHCPPEPRRKREGRVCRSPVSLLGIRGVADEVLHG